ncbi:MAG: hypothetical protein AB7P31_12800 [Steroidobacteraceae bacterium]
MYTKEELQSVNSMNRATVRAACSAANIKGYSKMTVAQMRTAVQQHMEREMAAAVKAAPVPKKASPVIGARCEVQNGVRKPITGVCADVWLWMSEHRDADAADVRAWAEKKSLNVSNAMQERSAFRRFHGITSAVAAQAA